MYSHDKKTKTAGQKIDEMTDKIKEVTTEIGEKLESWAEGTKRLLQM